MKNHRLQGLVAWVLGLLAWTPASASALDLAFEMGTGVQRLAHASSAPLTVEQGLSGGLALTAGARVTENLSLEADWYMITANRDLFGALNVATALDHWSGGVRWQRPWSSSVEPYARAGLGATRVAVSVLGFDGSQFHALEGTSWAPHAQAGVGLDFLLPRETFRANAGSRKHNFTLGATAELGWRHVLGQDVQLTSARPSGLTMQPVDAGELVLSGMTLRLAFVLRL